MLKGIIPGHVRAHSLWVCLILMVVVYVATHSLIAVLGAFLVVSGMFLEDQATHLAQKNHQGFQPTSIERDLQKHRWTYVVLGYIFLIGGTLLLIVR